MEHDTNIAQASTPALFTVDRTLAIHRGISTVASHRRLSSKRILFGQVTFPLCSDEVDADLAATVCSCEAADVHQICVD